MVCEEKEKVENNKRGTGCGKRNRKQEMKRENGMKKERKQNRRVLE